MKIILNIKMPKKQTNKKKKTKKRKDKKEKEKIRKKKFTLIRKDRQQ